MKRKFTLLIAALALLTMIVQPGRAWGQTKSEVTDVLNRALTGVTGTSYSSWTGKTSNSDAVWAGQSAGGNDAIQLRSNNNNSGIITTASGGTVTKVVVTWQSDTQSGRTLNVYGKSAAYSSPADLYNANNQGTLIGTIVCGTSTELTITDSYEYIGMRSASGAMYLSEVDVTWSTGGTPSPSITADNVSIEYNATSGSITYTINNGVDGGTLTASTESDWLTLGTVGETVPFTCSANEDMIRTAQVTLTYTYGNDNVTKNVTVTQAANPNGPGSENNPYTVAQAHAAIDAGTGTQGVYATGIVSQIVTPWGQNNYQNITFNIVDNTSDEEFLQAFRCVGDEGPNVIVGDIVVVTGNLTKYGSTYEFAQGCTIVSLTHTTTTHTLTYSVTPQDGGSLTVGTYSENPATVAEGAEIEITATPNTGYTFGSWIVSGAGSSVADENAASTTFTMGTENATLTANFTVVNTYTVTYHANVPGTTDIEYSYNEGEDVTIANNTFSNPGHAFTKWNTNENGSGTDYMPGAVIQSIATDYELWAQWEQSSEATDVLNWAATGSPTNYTDWTYTAPSGTAYAGQSSGTYQSIQLRSNNNNSGIITTTSVGTATKVVVVWNSNTTDGRTLNIYGKNTAYEAVTDLYGDNAGELLGSIVCGTSTELTISGGYAFIGMRAASGAMYFDEIDITWNTSGVLPPSISADDIELTYDATEGEIEYTINNPAGGTLSASTQDEWIQNFQYEANSVTFNCNPNPASNARTATVTLTYTYGDNQTVTKDVTVTQAGAPVIYTTISDLFAAATSTATDVTVAFDNWHVTGISTNGKNVFVTDGTNGFVIYDNNGGLNEIYAVNDDLSGTTTASLKLQNGFAQLTSVDADQLTLTQGSDIDYADIAMANLAGVNTGALIHYENLTCSVENNKYYLSDGTTQLQVYNSLFAFEALVSGKVYNISGVYQQYNTTKEVLPRNANDIEETVEPSITVNPTEVNATAAETVGTIDVTLTAIANNDIAIEWFESDGTTTATYNHEWIQTDITTDKDIYYVIGENTGDARSAYFKVFGLDIDDNYVYSNLVTINQAAPVVDYAVLPFEFNEGRADIENTDGLSQEGLGTDYNASSNPTTKLKFDGTGDWIILKINEVPGKLTFDIKNNSFSGGTFTVQTSEDGVTYTDLENYTTITGTQSEEFDNLNENVRYIKWIYTEKASGNVGLGNIKLAKPDNTPSITLSSYSVDAPCTETDGSITVTYKNLTSFIADIEFYDDNNEPVDEYYYDWLTAGINSDNDVEYIIEANDGGARTAYFKVYAYYDNSKEYVYSDLVTVIQAAYTPPVVTENYALFTGELVEGDYIIYYDGKALNTTVTSNRLQYAAVTPANNVIATDNSDIIWHITPNGEYWTVYNATADAYAASTGTKNQAQMMSDGTDDKALWTVTGTETYEFVNKYNSEKSINANLRNNGTYGFACYATGTGGALTLYKRASAIASYKTVIAGYGDNEGGYCLIASPVSADPTNVTNMMTEQAENYDLYWFDQANDEAQWRNYKANSFYLTPGKGYLYARNSDAELTFNGLEYEGNGTINLTYADGATFDGWNLIGNPFGTESDLDKAYYRMNSTGDGFEAVTNDSPVNVMEGVFVKATASGQSATFSPSNSKDRKAVAKTNIMVANANGTVVDNVIIRFDGGSTLEKFSFRDDNTKLYIPQDDADYAIVNSNATGELSLYFKAATTGNYTISMKQSDADLGYLHLIDRLTGADVNMLLDDYTFVGSPRDTENRFIVRFSENSNGMAENNYFAYQNGDQIIVNGNGELQVFDATGRMVMNTNVNGIQTVNVPATGMYIFRMVGESVQTQKIVVR